jgi:deazaflavin-dependent oxidoreductase (nitroreductase family)
MKKVLTRTVLGLLLALGALGAVFLLGMRSKSPAVIDRVRRFNRGFTNPRVLRSAGTPGASASIVRHVGRTSGRTFETPIGPIPTADGFLVALPYGRRSDWLKNVLAAGGATLVHAGTTYTVDQPTVVVTADVLSELPAGEQRTLRLFAVDECLRLRAAEAPSGGTDDA